LSRPYYLVEGRRDGRKVRQKVIRYIGKYPLLLTGAVANPHVEQSAVPPIYTGFTDIATPVLEQLTGRHTVSKQFIADLARSPTIRQAERDIITAVLTKMPDGKISVQEFADKVHAELLPLKGVTLGQGVRPAGGLLYEPISLDEEIRGDVNTYMERIYESPIETSAGHIHFSQLGITNYFAHTRIEDMADAKTRRVIEVQSDLFQRGRLELEKSRVEPELIDYTSGSRIVTPAHRVDRTAEIAKLELYEDTWYERIIHEEVKKAAADGKTRLQFPTGETAMKIEGLGERNLWEIDGTRATPEQLEVGKTIRQVPETHGDMADIYEDEWVVTDVLGDGKFKAIPLNAPESMTEDFAGPSDFIQYIKEHGDVPFDLRSSVETFDISGKVDITNPIYRFYEQRVQRCLKRFRPTMQRVTDQNGVSWFQIQLIPTDATRPVSAFGVARSPDASNSTKRVRHNT